MNPRARAELRAVLNAYEALLVPSLSDDEAYRRGALQVMLCMMTETVNVHHARNRARRMLGIRDDLSTAKTKKKRRNKKAKAKRYAGLANVIPRPAAPRTPDAVRVTSVVSNAPETNRRTH